MMYSTLVADSLRGSWDVEAVVDWYVADGADVAVDGLISVTSSYRPDSATFLFFIAETYGSNSYASDLIRLQARVNLV